MILSDIPNGATVFIDANVLIYSLAPDPQFGVPCQTFTDRIKNREISGVISAHILTNIAHRLMTIEANSRFGWPHKGVGYRLKKNSSSISQLTRFKTALTEIQIVGIQVVPTEAADVIAAAQISIDHGLLSGDALVAATMRRGGINSLVSNDPDFDRVPWITRFEIV